MIENLAMLVGQRLSERRIAGTVVWKSGRRLEFPYLDVYSGDEYVLHIPIKDDGRFECTLYGDFAYSIEAGDNIDEIEGRSPRIKLPPGDSPPLKLVMERVKPLSKRRSP